MRFDSRCVCMWETRFRSSIIGTLKRNSHFFFSISLLWSNSEKRIFAFWIENNFQISISFPIRSYFAIIFATFATDLTPNPKECWWRIFLLATTTVASTSVIRFNNKIINESYWFGDENLNHSCHNIIIIIIVFEFVQQLSSIMASILFYTKLWPQSSTLLSWAKIRILSSGPIIDTNQFGHTSRAYASNTIA